MKYLSIILTFLLGNQFIQAQSELVGVVTFITSDHVYVRFSSTNGINLGDTLLTKGMSCLLVAKKSSTSCVCQTINNCSVSKNEQVSLLIHHTKPSEIIVPPSISDTLSSFIPNPIRLVDSVNEEKTSSLYKERIRGRLSVSTYSSIAPDVMDNRHRYMIRGSVSAYHINNSRYSFESYINYRHNVLQSNPNYNQTSFFRLYNLALTYDVNGSTSAVIGRKINRKLSSVGAIDGIQLEHQAGHFYGGVIARFRPDIREFDFNTNLFQYGGYIGFHSENKSNSTETTIGYLEQRNRGLDRRYVYLQHRSTIGRKLSFFSSMEMDIYGKVDGVKNGDPRMTNLYLSTRYRFNRKASLAVSYDTRKRIIYYETLHSEIERLLEDDEARQGLRLTLNLRPLKYIKCGISTSYRFQKSEANKSNNINAYVSHGKIPVIEGSLSARINYNSSNYLKSQIISFRYARQLLHNKLSSQLYFRNANYSYENTELQTSQQYYGLNLSLRMSRSVSLSVLTELTSRDDDNHYRLNTKLIKRFHQKNKNESNKSFEYSVSTLHFSWVWK